jgi:hypothetical protein
MAPWLPKNCKQSGEPLFINVEADIEAFAKIVATHCRKTGMSKDHLAGCSGPRASLPICYGVKVPVNQ